MSEQVPVTLYVSDYAVFLENEDFFIRVSNSVAHDPADIWEQNENGEITVAVNEGKAEFSQRLFHGDLEEVTTGTVELLSAKSERFLVGFSQNIPGYSPYFVRHTETGNIYCIVYEPHAPENEVTDPLFETSEREARAEQFEKPVLVENVETGVQGVHGLYEIQSGTETGEFQYLLPFVE